MIRENKSIFYSHYSSTAREEFVIWIVFGDVWMANGYDGQKMVRYRAIGIHSHNDYKTARYGLRDSLIHFIGDYA